MPLVAKKCTQSLCSNFKKCSKMPIELEGAEYNVDVAIYLDSPNSESSKGNKPCLGDAGELLKNIIADLENKYGFSYYISYITKCEERTTNLEQCIDNVIEELNVYNPKVVICVGTGAHKVFHDSGKFSILMEEGCIRKIRFRDKSIVTISTISPNFVLGNYPPSAGFIHTAIRKAIIYAKQKKHFNISNKYKVEYLDTIPKIKKVFKYLLNTESYIACDTETANLFRAFGNQILTIQFCNDGETGFIIPISHYQSPFSTIEQSTIKNLLIRLFTGKSKALGYVFHNSKFDMHQIFRETGVLVYNAPIVDTSFAEYCLEENWAKFEGKYFDNGKGPYSLYTCTYKRGFKQYKEDDKNNRYKLASTPIEEWLDYAAIDPVVTYNLFQSQRAWAQAIKYDKFELMSIKYSTSISKVLTYAEHCGLPTDIEVIRELYNPRTSPLKKEMDNILKEYQEFESVKKVNKLLARQQTGTSKSLFGPKNLFDPNKASHKELLFIDTLGLAPIEKKKKKKKSAAVSFDKDFQNAYKDTVEEVGLLVEWSALQKLITSYVNNIYDFMNRTTGDPDFYTDTRVRPSFRPIAVTGRLTSSRPNSQQRPSRGSRASAVLKMYKAPKGRALIKLDYSTFEVRGLGFMSEDKAMIKSFLDIEKIKGEYRQDPECFSQKGFDILDAAIREQYKKAKKSGNNEEIDKVKKEHSGLKEKLASVAGRIWLSMQYVKNITDFHKHSASLFFNTPVLQVSKDQRSRAKNFVFGSIYGMGTKAIAGNLGITEKEAEAIYKIFMSKLHKAVQWLDNVKKLGRKHLFVESPIGRRRHVWGFLFPDKKKGIHGQMDRLCMNSGIQGFCSDLNVIATGLLIDYIFEQGKGKYQVLDSEAWMVNNLVHDSCEMEVPVQDVLKCVLKFEEFFTTLLEEYILKEYGYKIKIPVAVDFAVGLSLDKMKDWDGTIKQIEEYQKELLEQDKQRT